MKVFSREKYLRDMAKINPNMAEWRREEKWNGLSNVTVRPRKNVMRWVMG